MCGINLQTVVDALIVATKDDMPNKYILVDFDKNNRPVGENFIVVNNSDCKNITGHRFSDLAYKPWAYRVVKLSSPNASKSIYRLLRGAGPLSICKDHCWLNVISRKQLGVDINHSIIISVINQFYGRLLYYLFHPDDTLRFTTRLGLCAIIVSVMPYVLNIVMYIYKTFK